ncbi:MAG: glycoside hydrolase family 127 protein [Dysgonamonadaceae bacterium]|jgi:DUF1680 family protein|nr:glycoside hydrolase family 127 protein [Dysgonamonadaceae bacterium]
MKLNLYIAIIIFLCPVTVEALDGKTADKLYPSEYGSLKIGGYVGKKIDLCIENRVMAQDVDRVVRPFYLRNDEFWGFRSEFWGKWFTSAMLGYGYSPTQKHREIIDGAVDKILKSQTADGYIGTYPDEHHLKNWDVWGRKYVLLGLLAYHDQTGDAEALDAAIKVAVHLIGESGPESGVNLAATGWIGWKGLAPSSVLEPIALLYEKTGDKRFLEYARHIVSLWDQPNELAPRGLRLIQDAVDRAPLREMGGVPKAYEMMSCFEGLCELYRITGNRTYFEACSLFVGSIIRDEIMLVGSGSVHEIWCDGKACQHGALYQGLETCVTVTWMKLLYQMLRLTGDSKYADQLEISLYNALMASQTPNGDWWSYYTGLMGERVPSHLQFPDVIMSCCVANGPRAMLLTPSWAVMKSDDGVAVNLYAPLKAGFKTRGNQKALLVMETGYPVEERVGVKIEIPVKEYFTVSLRIPEWSGKTRISVNGKAVEAPIPPGKYFSISGEWKNNDRIELVFDLTAKVAVISPEVNYRAIQRGPVILAFDTRLVPLRDGVDEPPMYRYKFDNNPDGSILLKPRHVDSAVNDIWMMFDVPVVDESGGRHELPMCDYASAGNTWQERNVFRVWIPQPFDFRHLYVNNMDWRINVTRDHGDSRPVIPELYKK